MSELLSGVPSGILEHSSTEREWVDFCACKIEPAWNLKEDALVVGVNVLGLLPALRVAIGSQIEFGQWEHCAESPLACNLGKNIFVLREEDFITLRGNPRLTHIDHFTVGGFAQSCQITMWVRAVIR
jgi:hypothetical protein